MQKTSEPSTPSMGRVSSIEKAVGGMRSGEGEYPERVGQPECLYYMKIAVCRLGPSCKYYHLRVREGGGSVGPMALNIFGRRPHYMKTRICNFGESCKYHHPRVGQGGGSVSSVALNTSGYPLRPGERECSYFLKTSKCNFGSSCKFHHPQSTYVQAHAPTTYGPSSKRYGVMAGNWPVVRPALNNSRYPLRPGETKCWYFLKTGECNFDITCKFHHPQSACVQVAAPTLVPAQSLFGPSSQQYEIRMELKVLMELLVQFPSFLHPKK